MNRLIVSTLTAALLVAVSAEAPAQGAAAAPSDVEIRQAMSAVERAQTYREILDATRRYESVLASDRTLELAEGYLRGTSLNQSQRALITLERQLAIDCGERGATVAAQLLALRIVSGSALLADTPEQLAGVLDRFAELSGAVTVDLVQDALAMRGATWPPALLPLMEQLAIDWPKYGAIAAARRMADAANAATPPPQASSAAPSSGPILAAHWRNTRIVFESPVDEHLVLNADGTAETWTVRASGREPSTRGRWHQQDRTLIVEWEDGRRRSQPFTFYEAQLVLPNIPNQRQFWDLVR